MCKFKRARKNGCAAGGAGCVPLPEVTNLVSYSQEFDHSNWGKVGSSGPLNPVVTPNAAAAPDSTMTADIIAFGDTSGAGTYSLIRQQPVVTSGQTYTASVWLRCSSGTKTVYMYPADGVTYGSVPFTVTTTWTRFSVTKVAGSSAMGPALGVDRNDGSQSAQPAQSIEAWGMQFELGPAANRYVVTDSGPVTSPAVVC